ncbi:unnamed protein product, partial [Staurois parvus]
MYVKCIETAMFYYIIIIFKKITFLKNFKFDAGSGACTSRRSQGTEDGCRLGDMARDAAGGD